VSDDVSAARANARGARDTVSDARDDVSDARDDVSDAARDDVSDARDDISDARDDVFDARGLGFRYHGATRDAVARVDLCVRTGEFVALLGPNGSGKSTLLRLLLGALTPAAGTVLFQGRAVRDWPRAALARRIGVVTQAEDIAFPLTVRELVAMGRYPHLGAWRREAAADRAAIQRALERCGLEQLAARSILELSGGERQRARLARALAQEPRTFVLDEPTASLDIAHEMQLFELLDALAADGATVLLVTHNINIAARYAARLVLLADGRVAAAGEPWEVLTREVLEPVYRWPVAITEADGAPQVVPARR
jgi:iron complex transport system ATP-binding protein